VREGLIVVDNPSNGHRPSSAFEESIRQAVKQEISQGSDQEAMLSLLDRLWSAHAEGRKDGVTQTIKDETDLMIKDIEVSRSALETWLKNPQARA